MPQQSKLSRRQLQVLGLAARGNTCREIADTLELKESTIRNYLIRTREKLGASNTTHAVFIEVTTNGSI